MPGLKTLLSAAILTFTASQGLADMTEDDIRNGFREHAAMAQFHRWFQVYERPGGGIENAVDILSDDVTVTSGLGTANGHDDYAARVSQLPETWLNSHRVGDVEFTHGTEGEMTLNAAVNYQNEGMLPDGQMRAAGLSYAVTFQPGTAVLPKLSEVKITQNSEAIGGTYSDAYAENRMLSLVHYWLALIEDPARDPAPVQEILADEFSLNFSSGAITDFAGFKAWLAGPGSQVAASTHVISNFSATDLGDETYGLSVDFDWFGITPDGTELVAKTRHAWTAQNDVTARFAQIKTMDVEVLEPFRPREN